VPFRLALIGAGRIGAFHAEALASSTAISLSALVDPRRDAREAVGPAFDRHFGSIEELMAAGGIDGALVAVPTRLHLPVVSQLARHRIPILCEKPCGRTVSEAERIRGVVQRNNCLLRVAFWRRYVPTIVEVREGIRLGSFGELSVIFSAQWDEIPPAATFRNPESSGGLVVDTAVHDFDLVRWLTGQRIIRACGFASSTRFHPPVEGDYESASLALLLSGGSTALVSIGRRHPPGELHSLWVIGTRAAVKLAYVDGTDVQVIRDAFRSQTEDFADVATRASDTSLTTRLASVDDAIAALRTAEETAGALELNLA